MSVNVTLALQATIVDPSVDVTPNPVQAGGIPIYCANGVSGQDATLASATSSLPLNFPVGVTTATFIFISSVTVTDLQVNVGNSPFPISIPLGQGIILYNLTSAQVSISSVLGGLARYVVGG